MGITNAVIQLAALSAAASFALSGCSRTQTQATAAAETASAPTTAAATIPPLTVTPSAAASATASAPASGTATPLDDNLLTLTNGAIVRKWSVVPSGAGQALVLGSGYVVEASYAQPVTLLYELPAAAQIARFGAVVDAPSAVTIAIAAGMNPHSLSPTGIIHVVPTSPPAEAQLNASTTARYVQFTITRAAGTQMIVRRLAAYGNAGVPPSQGLGGDWLTSDSTDGSGGSLFGSVKGEIPQRLPADARGNARETLVRGQTLLEYYCSYGAQLPVWQGTIAGGIVTGPNGDRLRSAGDGNLLVGQVDGVKTILMRASVPPRACRSSFAGSGRTVLVMTRFGDRTLQESDPSYFAGYRFHRILAPAFAAGDLRGVAFTLLDGECTATQDFSAQQQRTLLRWVAAGNKLIVRDADMCKASDYSFLPYPLKTSATGALGAPGRVLTIADPSDLGTQNQGSPHYVDTRAYLSSVQEIGDSDIMKTDDLHWCGHMLAVNANGVYGWVHAYARYGRGLIVYNGFDHDDLGSRIPAAMAISRFEYLLPANAELPCNARVASKLVLYPSFDERLPAGVPKVVRVPLTMVYSGAASASVALHVKGDAAYAAAVSPPNVDAPSEKPVALTANIALPKGWSGLHAFTVYADAPNQTSAQTTIVLDGSVPLAQAFARQRRVRVYGIHFDVDSATIRPESEATIAQIAEVLRANPAWRLRVEGYTDSDGGAAYNLRLSERRAQSVVNDLVLRDKIARSRLTPAGFGLTHPVASNDTEAGKALNRRVELVRT